MMKTALTALIATAVLGSVASAATLVNNGSFEMDADLKGTTNKIEFSKLIASDKGWDTYSALPGWTSVDRKSAIKVHTDKGAREVDAEFGETYVELDGKSSEAIRQTLTLKLGSYELSFFFSPAKDTGGDEGDKGSNKQGIGYSIADLSGTIRNQDGAVGKWTEVTGIFNILKDGDYDLNFASSSSSDKYRGFIDNVAVNSVPSKVPEVAPVPLPAAGLLLVAAVGGLAMLRRRRAAS